MEEKEVTWREFKQYVEDQGVKDYDEIILLVPTNPDELCAGLTNITRVGLRQHLDPNTQGSSTWDIGDKYDG